MVVILSCLPRHLLVMFPVMRPAKPTNVQRLGIIIVVAVHFGIAADLAGLALNLAHAHGVFQNPPDAHLMALNRVRPVPFGLEPIVVRIVGAVLAEQNLSFSRRILLVNHNGLGTDDLLGDRNPWHTERREARQKLSH